MLKFRPHHFLCTLGFEGKGYSDEFVQNYSEIVKRLREMPRGDDEMVLVVSGSDSICTACPNRREEACESEAKISRLDQAHSEVTGLVPGDELTWGEAKQVLAEKFSIEDHHQACASCSWRAMGVCEDALRRLRKSRKSRKSKEKP